MQVTQLHKLMISLDAAKTSCVYPFPQWQTVFLKPSFSDHAISATNVQNNFPNYNILAPVSLKVYINPGSLSLDTHKTLPCTNACPILSFSEHPNLKCQPHWLHLILTTNPVTCTNPTAAVTPIVAIGTAGSTPKGQTPLPNPEIHIVNQGTNQIVQIYFVALIKKLDANTIVYAAKKIQPATMY